MVRFSNFRCSAKTRRPLQAQGWGDMVLARIEASAGQQRNALNQWPGHAEEGGFPHQTTTFDSRRDADRKSRSLVDA